MGELWCSVLFLLTVLLSNTIQVITGFAGAMLAMPVSIRLIGLEPAKAILNIVTMASGVCGVGGQQTCFKNVIGTLSSAHVCTSSCIRASGAVVRLSASAAVPAVRAWVLRYSLGVHPFSSRNFRIK